MKIRLYIYNAMTGQEFDEINDSTKAIELLDAFGKFHNGIKNFGGFIMVSVYGRSPRYSSTYTEHFDGATVKRACEYACNVISVLQ